MTIHWKQVRKCKFLQWLLIGWGHMLLSISMCQSTWFVKLVSWLGRRGFWDFLNLNITSVCQKKLMIWSSCFIHGWCQEQNMLALQGMFINKSVCYSVTWRSYTSHARRSFPSTRLGCQSFVNADLGSRLQSHLVLILYVCVLSTKIQNCWWFLQCHQQEYQETRKGFLLKQKQTNESRWRRGLWTQRWNRIKLLIV